MEELVKTILEPVLKCELEVDVTELRGKRFAVNISKIPLNSLEADEDLLYLVKKGLSEHYSKRTIALSIFNFKRHVRNINYRTPNLRAMH